MKSWHGVELQCSVVLLLLLVTMATGFLMMDPHCLSIGGVCLEASMCSPSSKVNETGYCGATEEIVCCHQVPENSSCHQHGGGCMAEENCRNVNNFGQLDCERHESCCLLIF